MCKKVFKGFGFGCEVGEELVEVEVFEGVGEGVFDDEVFGGEVVEGFAVVAGAADEFFFYEGLEAAVGVAEVCASVFGDVGDLCGGDVEEGAEDVFLCGADAGVGGVVFDAAFFEVGFEGAGLLGGEFFKFGYEGGLTGGDVVRVLDVGFEEGEEDGGEGLREVAGVEGDGVGAEVGGEEAEGLGGGVGGG